MPTLEYTKVDFETISCMVWCSGYTGPYLGWRIPCIFDCRIPYADCSVYRSTAIGAAAFDCVGYFRCPFNKLLYQYMGLV